MRFLHLDLEALSAWPDLKPAQLFIFAYIKRLCESRSEKVERHRLPDDDGAYTWADYEVMLEALPALNIGYRALRDNIDALVSSGLVERVTRTFQKSSKSYFRIAQAYYDREDELDTEASQGKKSSSVERKKSSSVDAEERQKTSPDRSSLDRVGKTGEGASPSLNQEKEDTNEEDSPSLLSGMREVAWGKGHFLDTDFVVQKVKSMKDRAWGKCASHTVPLVSFAESIRELQDEGRASDGNILRAWARCLETNPEKAAHFAEDYSKYCRQLADEDLQEHERIKAMERSGARTGWDAFQATRAERERRLADQVRMLRNGELAGIPA